MAHHALAVNSGGGGAPLGEDAHRLHVALTGVFNEVDTKYAACNSSVLTCACAHFAHQVCPLAPAAKQALWSRSK